MNVDRAIADHHRPIDEPKEQVRALRLIAAAHRFGTVNRLAIFLALREALAAVAGKEAGEKTELLGDFAHDTIFPELIAGVGRKEACWAHRKGAVRLRSGEAWPDDPILSKLGRVVFVPGALGTKAYVGVAARPNPMSHRSCNHGSGRTIARTDAGRLFSEDDVRRELSGVGVRVFRLGGRERLGELSRHGFRDTESVAAYMEAAGLIHLVAVLRPMAVLKG